jgi:hypothetical protein
MGTCKIRSDFQATMEILKNPSNPDYVRVSVKEWAMISLIMCFIFCFPASVLIGIPWLIYPKEVPVFACMSIPWIFCTPFVFVCVWIYNYRKPRRNDEVIKRLFTPIETDTPISPESGCSYIMHKDDFIYKLLLRGEMVPGRTGKKNKRTGAMIVHMFFDYEYDNIQQYYSLVENMYAYLEGKRIGNHIVVGCHTLGIRVGGINTMTPEWMKRIVDEFVYLTKRFLLRLITLNVYNERIEKINKLYEAERDTQRD